MRHLAAVALLLGPSLLLAACHKPSFDERYEDAEKTIREKAAAIDKELAERAQAPASAAPGASASPAPAALPSQAR